LYLGRRSRVEGWTKVLIGELADAAGVTSQAVRFYERKGLLPNAERGANGYRVYDESTLTRLRFVNVAQAAGLTLSEIGSILDLRDDGTVPWRNPATGKTEDVPRGIDPGWDYNVGEAAWGERLGGDPAQARPVR